MGWLTQTIMNINDVLPVLFSEPQELVNTICLEDKKRLGQSTLKKAILMWTCN